MKRNLSLWILGITTGLLLSAVPAFAQVNPGLMSGNINGCNFMTGEISFECIPNYIAFLIKTVFSFIGTICLIQIIIAGYEIAKGSLDGNKEAGIKRMKNAIIGFIFSILCFAIVDAIVGIVV